MVSLGMPCKLSLALSLHNRTSTNKCLVRALPKGPQREHFLAVATPENVANMKKADHTGTIFDRADYGRAYSTTTSYTPSAAWAWLVCDDEHPKMLAYNDI